MEVILGKKAGFCPGTTNAIGKAQRYLKNNSNMYCLGEIVHNRQVVDRLKKDGIRFIETIEEIPDGSELIIRAHGVQKEIYQKAKERNISLFDLTCPKIVEIRKIVKQYEEKGYYMLIMGEHNHPETVAMSTFCGEHVRIIETMEDIEEAIEDIKATNIRNIAIISQTTFSMERFDRYVKCIKRNIPKDSNLEINKTICDSTRMRQEETKEIAKQVELMIIIGGKNSANTNKLYEIALDFCNNAMKVETMEDLYLNYVRRFQKVGVMAGASTPQEFIQEVVEAIQKEE